MTRLTIAEINLTILLMAALLTQSLHAAQLRVQVVDLDGNGMANAAVSVRPLEPTQAREIPRLVTGAQGWTQPLDLRPGLYQFTATESGFMNSVREIFVDNSSASLEIWMRTRSEIDWVAVPKGGSPDVPNQGRAKWRITVQFRFKDQSRKPVVGARVLLRDSEGSNQRWAQTDDAGKITVEMPEQPDVFFPIPTLVLPIQRSVYTFVLLGECDASNSMDLIPHGATCVRVKDSSAEIEVPSPKTISSE